MFKSIMTRYSWRRARQAYKRCGKRRNTYLAQDNTSVDTESSNSVSPRLLSNVVHFIDESNGEKGCVVKIPRHSPCTSTSPTFGLLAGSIPRPSGMLHQHLRHEILSKPRPNQNSTTFQNESPHDRRRRLRRPNPRPKTHLHIDSHIPHPRGRQGASKPNILFLRAMSRRRLD